jgi:hypothetical protein
VSAVVGDGHGIGEDVIELGNGLFREEFHPFAAFGLHRDKGGLALHGFEVVVDAGIVGDREIQAAIDGDAVENACLPGKLESFIEL